MDTGQPKIVGLAEVTPMSWAGEERARFLLRGTDTGGLYSFYEVIVPPGEGSVFHIHEDMDEAFYIVEGEFEITLGDDVHKVPAGVLAYGPRGVGHSFVNTWHKPSTMLCTTTPGGIEKFFEELSQLMKARPRPEWERMRDLARQHHIISFRPPDGPNGGSPDAALRHLNQEGIKAMTVNPAASSSGG
jgi:mannose-6-phosphate isomerase-like protein (cupin superfamily)